MGNKAINSDTDSTQWTELPFVHLLRLNPISPFKLNFIVTIMVHKHSNNHQYYEWKYSLEEKEEPVVKFSYDSKKPVICTELKVLFDIVQEKPYHKNNLYT